MVIFFLMTTEAVTAQHTGSLPDSVVINDSVPAASNSIQPLDSSLDNTVNDKKTESEERLVSRIVPDSVVISSQRDKDFEYANDPAYWVKKKETTEVGSARIFTGYKWLRAAIFLLLGAILLFAFYKIIVENKMYLFYSSSKSGTSATDTEVTLQEEDLDEMITTSLGAGDFRSTIRFMYLKALKNAGERGLIHFRQHATNQDYIREIQDPSLHERFRFLTGAFEYTWYGGFAIAPQQFAEIQNQFEQFYKSIAH